MSIFLGVKSGKVSLSEYSSLLGCIISFITVWSRIYCFYNLHHTSLQEQLNIPCYIRCQELCRVYRRSYHMCTMSSTAILRNCNLKIQRENIIRTKSAVTSLVLNVKRIFTFEIRKLNKLPTRFSVKWCRLTPHSVQSDFHMWKKKRSQI